MTMTEIVDERQRLVAALAIVAGKLRDDGLTNTAATVDRAVRALACRSQEQPREALIKHMVDRFLMWKLPTHFRPDDGISFDPISSRGTKYERRREPTGTNLFDVDQATAMVRHMLDGAPVDAPPSAVPVAVSVSPAAAQEH